jgi:hypothetical protein
MNPRAHHIGVVNLIDPPYILPKQHKILIPGGTAKIIVAAVKYALVSTSIPTIYM